MMEQNAVTIKILVNTFDILCHSIARKEKNRQTQPMFREGGGGLQNLFSLLCNKKLCRIKNHVQNYQ